MTERGLYLDLARMMDSSIARAMNVNRSWALDHVYVVDINHRMHDVCSTLEALNYLKRRYNVGEGAQCSAWSFTEEGIELYEELHHTWRRRRNGLD